MSDTGTPSQQPLPAANGPYPPPQPGMPPTATITPGNSLATAGFVLGLIGFIFAWIPILNLVMGIVLGVLGVVFAAIGLSRAKNRNTGKGLSIAGLVLGLLAVLISILMTVAIYNAADDAVNKATSSTVKPPAGSTADKNAGSTRNNPVPLGSAITGADWTVTINSVTTASKDSLGSTPASGSTLLVVNLTATYNGEDEQGESAAWASVKFVTADGNTIDSTSSSTLFVADDAFDSLKTVYSGASVTGNEILEVPADTWQNGVLAVSPGIISDSVFVKVS